MNKWLEQFDRDTTRESQKPNCANYANCEGVREKIDELNHLNQRWQKADALEKAGHFTCKSPEYEQKICHELRQICGRATDIWEWLSENHPESLTGLYLLYPNETGGEV